jgi:outer membrane receptor protein involved in Fe transport
MTLDPGHFHAALIQREMYPEVAPSVHVYAPLGPDLLAHLARVAAFNHRAEGPTSWRLEVHAGPDPLARMLREKPGNVVVLSGNSTNEEAEEGNPGQEAPIEIEPGNKIPLAPRHMGKAFADIQLTRAFSLNLNMTAFGSSFARGNENNKHEADGVYYLGPGKSGGYAVFNLGGRYQVNRRLQLFAQMNNVFNRKYYSAAQLGPNGFTAAGNFVARPLPSINGEFPVVQSTFYAPGSPRMVWGGIRLQF